MIGGVASALNPGIFSCRGGQGTGLLEVSFLRSRAAGLEFAFVSTMFDPFVTTLDGGEVLVKLFM